MPKIPKKKGKAADGGSANVNLGGEDSSNCGVGGSSDGSVMGATTRGRANGEKFFIYIMIQIIFLKVRILLVNCTLL